MLVIAAPVDAAKPCAGRDTITLAQNSRVRVYKKPNADHTAMLYFGCVKRTERTVRLETAGPQQIGYAFRLSGYAVGYAMYTQIARSDDSYNEVISWNIRTRKRVHRADAAGGTAASGVMKLLVTRTGALAWIDRAPADAQRMNYAVHIFDMTGNRLADSGTDVDGASLTLSDGIVSWTRAGVTKTATIGS